jgi:hypothetical protein
LSTGMPEDELPRTHNGVIAMFGQQVLNRHLDPGLGRALNAVESLRLAADYTGVEIDAATAERAVGRAETFVSAVELAFDIRDMALQAPGQPQVAISRRYSARYCAPWRSQEKSCRMPAARTGRARC